MAETPETAIIPRPRERFNGASSMETQRRPKARVARRVARQLIEQRTEAGDGRIPAALQKLEVRPAILTAYFDVFRI